MYGTLNLTFFYITLHTLHYTAMSTQTRALQPVATCRQSPYLHKPAFIIDVILIMTYRAYGVRSPRSHCDVILIVTSFALSWPRPALRTYVTYVRTP